MTGTFWDEPSEIDSVMSVPYAEVKQIVESGPKDDKQLFIVQEYLDAVDAGIGGSYEIYADAHAAAEKYVRAKLALNDSWEWPHCGAVEDIVENIREKTCFAQQQQMRLTIKPSKFVH